MLLLKQDDIKKAFSMRDAIEANKIAYRLFSDGKAEVPLRTVIPAPDANGSFVFMPSYAAEMNAAGLKVVNVFSDNPKIGMPTTIGQVMLIDGKTGEVTSLMDGTYVTALRTAAASGAAFDLWAPQDAKIGALIGTGSQAECQLEALLEVRALDEVHVAARNYDKTKAFVEKMSEQFSSYNTKIIAYESTNEAIKDADLITVVTVSETPTFDASYVKAGAVVSGVGSYLPTMQELDPQLFARASKIYFDSYDAVLSESGDLQKPLASGIITEADMTGDIGDYILGKIPGRESEDEIILFKNVGLGILDLIAAAQIYEKASAAGIGLEW